MIVEKTISIRRLLPIIWKRLALMALISAAIVVPMELFGLERYAIGMTTPLILGTAISIFLGFRTNSAYERWMSGRAIFGDICASVRNLALVLARVDERYRNLKTGKDSAKAPAIMTRMIRRGIALLYTFGAELQNRPDPFDFETAEELLLPEELDMLRRTPNPSLRMLFEQSKDFRAAAAQGQFLDGEHFEIVGIQRELSRLMNQAQALNNTPFPTHYTYFTDVFVWLLVVLLSLSLPATEVASIYVIPLVVIIGWTFSMIEGIGSYMDYPWMDNRNTVPVRFLAREQERQLRQLALGEDRELERFTPVEGALY
ncbi:MAG: bestrophin family ion channel [Litorimonas sp.]